MGPTNASTLWCVDFGIAVRLYKTLLQQEISLCKHELVSLNTRIKQQSYKKSVCDVGRIAEPLETARQDRRIRKPHDRTHSIQSVVRCCLFKHGCCVGEYCEVIQDE